MEYTIEPAIFFLGTKDVITCKSKEKKKEKAIKKFVKKHKKAIIIGAIILVTVAVVVVTAVCISSGAATAAAAGGALASAGGSPGSNTTKSGDSDQSLSATLKSQTSSFKEINAQELFPENLETNGVSLEENGRIVGSLFAHKTIETLKANAADNPLQLSSKI